MKLLLKLLCFLFIVNFAPLYGEIVPVQIRQTQTTLTSAIISGTTTIPLGIITSVGKVGIGTTTPAYKLDITGDIAINSIGNTLRIKEGTNSVCGTTILVSGSATVFTTAVTSNSRIFLTPQNAGSNLGGMGIYSRAAGVNFIINSSNILGTNTVAWFIIEPY